MATIAANIRYNLVVNAQPLQGLRWRLAVPVLKLAAWLFGGELKIGITPEVEIGALKAGK